MALPKARPFVSCLFCSTFVLQAIDFEAVGDMTNLRPGLASWDELVLVIEQLSYRVAFCSDGLEARTTYLLKKVNLGSAE